MNKFKQIRLEHNLKQDELAQLLGMAQASISHYEQGKQIPSNYQIMRYCKYFNVFPEYFDSEYTVTSYQTMTQLIRVLNNDIHTCNQNGDFQRALMMQGAIVDLNSMLKRLYPNGDES